jgi:hypothetical protein
LFLRVDVDYLPETFDGVGDVALLQELVALAGEIGDIRVLILGGVLGLSGMYQYTFVGNVRISS